MPDRVPASSPPPGSDRSLVLASGSRYRADVLRRAGWTVQIDPPDVDERAADPLLASLGAAGLAIELARRKLAAVAPRHHGVLVVAADQVGVLEGGDGIRLLTKQRDRDAAVDQLCCMSGTTHRLVNGVAASEDGGSTVVEGSDVVEVTMRAYSRQEAAEYVERFEPFDTSGSYRIEDGAHMAPLEPFVRSIHGAHESGVVGMPLPLLQRLIEQLAAADT